MYPLKKLTSTRSIGSSRWAPAPCTLGRRTIIDDGKRHVVILTIWDADAETKVYWRSPDGNDARTTIIPGKGIQTFQTAGEFKLEAVGEPNREVNYGYVLLGLRK